MTSADKRARQHQNKAAAKAAREAAFHKLQRRKTFTRASVAVVIFAGLVGALSLLRGGNGDNGGEASTTAVSSSASSPATSSAQRYTARITTNFGVIEVKLNAKHAPIATEHFVQLARDGFYDGLTWHRAASDFVIQGGDPNGDGSGGSGSSVIGEVPTDNYPLGSLAAAKAGTDPPGTFDSQFFIVTGSRGANLPNDYARFGRVVEGIEVAQQIEALAPASGDGPPTQPATIDSIEIIEPGAAAGTADTTGG